MDGYESCTGWENYFWKLMHYNSTFINRTGVKWIGLSLMIASTQSWFLLRSNNQTCARRDKSITSLGDCFEQNGTRWERWAALKVVITPLLIFMVGWTGWTVRGSKPSGGETFRKRPDRPWDPPSLLYNGYRIFHGIKAVGAWCWPPTPF
jgi:hypothetical protein